MSQVVYQRPLQLSAAFPPSAPPGAPPPESGPPGTAPPFAGLLEEQSTARTAPAEGDKKKGPQATPAAPAEGTATTAPAGEAAATEAPNGEASTGEPTAVLAGGEAAVAAVMATAGSSSDAPAGTTASTAEGTATSSGAATVSASGSGGAVNTGPASGASAGPTLPAESAVADGATSPTDVDGPKNHDIADFSAHQQGAAIGGGSTGSIALPGGAELVGDAEAPETPSVPAAPQATSTAAAEPRPEASFPATPKATAAEAPVPTAPATGKADEGAADAGKQGAGDQQPSPDGGRAQESPAPARTAPAVPSGVPAVTVPTAPTSPAPNVTFSSPTAPAPAPSAALEATLRMAGESGFTRARLTLRPAQLGGVEVFLREGSAGLTATVVAQTPQAAQMLESSATELQRRLAAQGLELSSLQISVGGESAGAAHGGRDRNGAAASTSGGARGASAEAVDPAEKTQTIDLGGGVLVDVLA